MLSNCFNCPFFQQSQNLPAIGTCSFHGDKVRGVDDACGSANAAMLFTQQIVIGAAPSSSAFIATVP